MTMDATFAILPLPLTRSKYQNQYTEYTHATLIFTKDINITDDIIKHTFSDYESALSYGSIILDIAQIGPFLQKSTSIQLATLLTVYVRSHSTQPTDWGLEQYFTQIHYSHAKTTIRRAEIVDADQASKDYPHLRTTNGHTLVTVYMALCKRYYKEEHIIPDELPICYVTDSGFQLTLSWSES